MNEGKTKGYAISVKVHDKLSEKKIDLCEPVELKEMSAPHRRDARGNIALHEFQFKGAIEAGS